MVTSITNCTFLTTVDASKFRARIYLTPLRHVLCIINKNGQIFSSYIQGIPKKPISYAEEGRVKEFFQRECILRMTSCGIVYVIVKLKGGGPPFAVEPDEDVDIPSVTEILKGLHWCNLSIEDPLPLIVTVTSAFFSSKAAVVARIGAQIIPILRKLFGNDVADRYKRDLNLVQESVSSNEEKIRQIDVFLKDNLPNERIDSSSIKENILDEIGTLCRAKNVDELNKFVEGASYLYSIVDKKQGTHLMKWGGALSTALNSLIKITGVGGSLVPHLGFIGTGLSATAYLLSLIGQGSMEKTEREILEQFFGFFQHELETIKDQIADVEKLMGKIYVDLTRQFQEVDRAVRKLNRRLSRIEIDVDQIKTLIDKRAKKALQYSFDRFYADVDIIGPTTFLVHPVNEDFCL